MSDWPERVTEYDRFWHAGEDVKCKDCHAKADEAIASLKWMVDAILGDVAEGFASVGAAMNVEDVRREYTERYDEEHHGDHHRDD